MTVKARKQGNSLMVTIPASIDAKEGTEFDVIQEANGVISLVPVHRNIFEKSPEYNLRAGIAELGLGDNGQAVGKENVW
ncbi:type II toxin-antitoxin system PemI/MazE family antitoxin [Levilactobacillus angrenensis]|uniref:Type II toxin-antitoxin system PemI/MazE family antitoxin n=1 Tax=Levilactobacillus angrenensis TaxID=2486020 RepID=A0ABW1U8Y1_9LACO|nr:AbrB family transcriptional regulator [Levilactobacillus angrenensis]